MTTTIRIARPLLDTVRADLHRPHLFASERVGFLFGRTGRITDGTLVLMSSYISVPDDQYVDDPTVGARINATAIRTAMQRVLTSRECCFHVHEHDLPGPLGFSKVDVPELLKLIPSFSSVAPASAHGAFLIGRKESIAAVWHASSKQLVMAQRVVIVGYPMQICELRKP